MVDLFTGMDAGLAVRGDSDGDCDDAIAGQECTDVGDKCIVTRRVAAVFLASIFDLQFVFEPIRECLVNQIVKLVSLFAEMVDQPDQESHVWLCEC